MNEPNRWLHLRHPQGFTDEDFERFRAHCEVWQAYVSAVLANWSLLVTNTGQAPNYIFFEPELSPDRKIATLPVGGDSNLGSRSMFENGASRMLSEYFPWDFKQQLEEGLTETINRQKGPQTYWRHLTGIPIPAST